MSAVEVKVTPVLFAYLEDLSELEVFFTPAGRNAARLRASLKLDVHEPVGRLSELVAEADEVTAEFRARRAATLKELEGDPESAAKFKAFLRKQWIEATAQMETQGAILATAVAVSAVRVKYLNDLVNQVHQEIKALEDEEAANAGKEADAA